MTDAQPPPQAAAEAVGAPEAPETMCIAGLKLRVSLAAPDTVEVARLDSGEMVGADNLAVATTNSVPIELYLIDAGEASSFRDLMGIAVAKAGQITKNKLLDSVHKTCTVTVTEENDHVELNSVVGFLLDTPIAVDPAERSVLQTDEFKLAFFVPPDVLRDAMVARTASMFAMLSSAAQELGFKLTPAEFALVACVSSKDMKAAIGLGL